jgi:hypothetical protein
MRLFSTRREQDRAPAPFIVGVARSGTTLLRVMLDAHPELAIPPETHFIPRALRAYRKGGGTEGALAQIVGHRRWPDFGLEESALRERARAAYTGADVIRAFFEIYAEGQGKPRWGDKSTNYVRHVRRIARALPEARFIHLIRDGRAVALSQLSVHFGPDTVADAATKWRDEIAKARRQGAAAETYVEVRYEDLVAHPEPVLRRVCEAAGLDWDPAVLEYRERAPDRISGRDHAVIEEHRKEHRSSVASPLSAERAERWREEMSPADRDAFESVAGDLLAELGYPMGAAAG